MRTEPLYGVVDVSHEIDEDHVYGRLVDLRPNIRVGCQQLVELCSDMNLLCLCHLTVSAKTVCF